MFMKLNKVMNRVYICHTFYHVYVATMRELNLRKKNNNSSVESIEDRATLILSTMSNNFGSMKERAEKSGVFEQVLFFDEKEDVTSDEVMAYHKDKGNIVLNLLQRIKYTKLLGKLQEEYVPVDLGNFRDVYVFCDSDPIGYYLNYKKIRYHALEDGLNSGKLDNQAMLANLGAWPLKKFMAKLGLIFIESGYSKYCIDYIVNDISVNFNPPSNIVESPFDDMWNTLTEDDHDIMAQIFVEDLDELKRELVDKGCDKPKAMLLTEPLCELKVRKQLFGDIIEKYSKDYNVIVKPHPRDLLDYRKEFPDVVVLNGRFPMEVINDIKDLQVDKLISIITQADGVRFAKQVEYLGMEFLDKYEDASVHRKMEGLTGKRLQ